VRVGADVLRIRRKEDESVQPGLVERFSGEGDATGRTTLRAPYSSGDMVSTTGETRRWWTDARELENKASQWSRGVEKKRVGSRQQRKSHVWTQFRGGLVS
jgi:hypothetical protein